MRALRSSIRSAHLRRRMASKAATTAAKAAAAPTADDTSRFYKHNLSSLDPGSPNTAPRLLSRLTTPVPHPLIDGKSNFIRTSSLLFELDGRKRRWDCARSHASVSCVIFHREKKAALVVRQWRPPVWAAALAEAQEENGGKQDVPPPPLEVGLTFELCAGILDKDKTLEETTAEEVAEECGFKVKPGDLRKIASYHSAIGTSGARHTVFAVSVDDSDALEAGAGGVASDGEAIEVVALPLDSFDAFCADDSYAKSAGLVFGLGWLEKRVRSGEAIGMKI